MAISAIKKFLLSMPGVIGTPDISGRLSTLRTMPKKNAAGPSCHWGVNGFATAQNIHTDLKTLR